MPSTTDNSLPYPASTDSPDVPYHLQQLAEAIETMMSPGWVSCTVNSPYGLSGTPAVRRIGSRVYMRYGIDNTGLSASTNYTSVITLPAGYAPDVNRYVLVASSAPGREGRSVIGSDGEIDLYTNTAVGSYYRWDGISWDLSLS